MNINLVHVLPEHVIRNANRNIICDCESRILLHLYLNLIISLLHLKNCLIEFMVLIKLKLNWRIYTKLYFFSVTNFLNMSVRSKSAQLNVNFIRFIQKWR